MKLVLFLIILVSIPIETVRADEVGTNDFRISDMGTDGTTTFSATFPAVAYNATNNEYLVVWMGDDTTDGEFEIYGQRINAATGAEVGTNDFRISDMGTDGNVAFEVREPAVAYNATNNEYLVVWRGDDTTDGEFEIFGQRLDAAGGELGTNDFRISDMGTDGNPALDATDPEIAYNATNNEYLVVWRGDDDTPPLVDNEYEIFGQRIDAATGAEVGTNDFRISDMGTDGDNTFRADDPAVAYNATNNEYLVVWMGWDNTAPLVLDEPEIFIQRINAATGAEVGTNDFRISDMGTDGDVTFAAFDPKIAYNTTNNEYLVVWWGDDNTAPLVDEDNEVFGQRIDATGAEVGTNDFRISDMGTEGDANFDVRNPDVAYNEANEEYLVVWHGDDNTAPLVDNETEIFGQRINGATGAEVGTNDFRISDMGTDGDVAFESSSPKVDYNATNNEYLVVWHGDDNTAPLVVNENEIFGQRLTDPGCGNGFVEAGEDCDDGNADNSDDCLDTCVAAACGDGVVQTGVEECDDGNTVDGDDCSATCTTEGVDGSGAGDGDAGGGGCSLLIQRASHHKSFRAGRFLN